MSIIEALWHGNISPCEKCGFGNQEIAELERLLEVNQKALCAKISEADITLFDRYAKCTEEYVSCIATQAFHDGFSLAAKLLSEALQHPNFRP